MEGTITPEPSPDRTAQHTPVWLPSQFKDDSELSSHARKTRARRRARNQDDYAGRDFTLGEVIANSVSQGVATALSIVALIILVVRAVSHGGGINLAAALIYAVPMALAFIMSLFYHALQSERAKRVFKVLDNSSTYLLIAGAFTPYCLLSIGGTLGNALFVAEWACAFIGVAIEALWALRPRWVHGVIYALMCLMFLSQMPTLITVLPAPGFWLLVAALLVLAAGLVFRWFSGVRYLRFVFHVIAIAGCVCLFLSVALFVI